MFRRKLRPAFENLEARDVPSVTMQTIDNGHTLRITGNSDWDHVQLVQNDQTGTLDVFHHVVSQNEDEITIQALNQDTFDTTLINKIIVNLHGGDDYFSYELAQGTNLTRAKQIFISTAAGNDTIKIDTAAYQQLIDHGGIEPFIEDGAGGGTSGVDSAGETESSNAGSKGNPEQYSQTDEKHLYVNPLALDRAGSAEAEEEAEVSELNDHSRIEATLGISIDTGNGDDQVDVVLGEIAGNVAVRVSTTLGKGKDSFALTSDFDLQNRASFFLDVNGGDDNDELDTTFAGHVHDGALVDVLLRGGKGDELMNTNFWGTLDGRFNLRQYGGDGHDRMSLVTETQEGSTGQLSFEIFGEAGHDHMTYRTLGADDPTLINALIDGGDNRNRAYISRDITVYRCTDIHRLAPMTPWYPG